MREDPAGVLEHSRHVQQVPRQLAAPELERTPPITDLLRVFRDWRRGLDDGVAGSR